MVGYGRVKRDGGRQEQKKTENQKKKKEKTEGSAQPQTISQIPEKGKCWVFFFFFPKIQKKTPKTCRSPSPVPRRSALRAPPRGRMHCRWFIFSVLLFLFRCFSAVVDRRVPGSSARPGAWPPLRRAPARDGDAVRCPRRGAAAAPRLRPRRH